MDATRTRANPWADLPPAQLPAKAMQTFLIIADRAPEPVKWDALALKIWPHVNDAEYRTAHNIKAKIALIRAGLGPAAILGDRDNGWRLGTLERRPVSTFGPGPGMTRGPEVPTIATVDGMLPDTAAALLRAQEWAQSQRPSARISVKSDGNFS